MTEQLIESQARADRAGAAGALAQMELIRAVEERLLALFSEGKLFGTTHTCIGQEVCAVGVVGALDLARDIVFSNHRCHGHFLVYSDDPDALIAEIMGRETGVSGGRGGSQHLCRNNFYSNGVQGGIVPVATGMALAEKFKGTGAIATCFLGDGTLGEGVIYEAFNLASLWQIPVLFVVEHNRYAQSTPTSLTIAGDIAARAHAFGIATDRRAADDPIAVREHVTSVVAEIRRTGKPFLQILDTYRLAAHSKGDDDRDPAEIEAQWQSDPLLATRSRLGDEAVNVMTAARARVDASVAAAESAPHATVDPHTERRAVVERGTGASAERAFAPRTSEAPPLVVHRLNEALHALMHDHEDVVVIGEDVLDPYGGAFKVSRGLSTQFPSRVLTTPISEAAIVGLGAGLSMRGLKPIVEIMFGDFLTLAADQIVNHLAKFHWMYNGQVETPIVIRTPVGARRGYGPTHSQSIEKMFFGVPGLAVVGVSLRHDPGELLRRATVNDPRPVLFIEQKTLYGKRLAAEAPPGLALQLHESERDALYPTGTWRPVSAQADFTIVTYGAMTEIVEQAIATVFDTDELIAEYHVVAQLAPLRVDPILDSVRRTKRLIVAEEASTPWGFGAEVVADITEKLGDNLRVARVGAHPLAIPNARPAEEIVLPSVADVVAAIRRVAQ